MYRGDTKEGALFTENHPNTSIKKRLSHKVGLGRILCVLLRVDVHLRIAVGVY